jgi:ComF family protein
MATIVFSDSQLCAVCQKGSIDGLTHPKCRTKYEIDGILFSVAYKGVVKKMIYQFKYQPFLSDLKGIMGRLMHEGMIQQEVFEQFLQSKRAIIIPVPLHSSRLKKRGYNQAELLARELSQKAETPYVVNVLKRVRQTAPQFELKREERQKNIKGAFSIDDRYKKKMMGKWVLLVDDITTTGSTLRECAKVLKKSGAEKVLGITFAHEAN